MREIVAGTRFSVLAALAAAHFVNDLLQALLPAIYPILKDDYRLDFWQIGLITMVNQGTASLLQPLVGTWFDRRPHPHSLGAGMALTLAGLLLLAAAPTFGLLIAAAALVGVGSAIFHPEASRVARLASGGRHGLAQSLFQTGGNGGSAVGPLAAAFIVLPRGQDSLGWFALPAVGGILLLTRVGQWYARETARARPAGVAPRARGPWPREARMAMAVLIALVVSKSVYIASLTNFYLFFLIERFGVEVHTAQLFLFGFLAAVAVGTLAGGPLGDRIGRKALIWFSILGALPFTLLLPSATLAWTGVLTVVIGLVISSAFSAILVFAQDLLPGRVGLVAGLFFGLAFGIGGLAAVGLGRMADLVGLPAVYAACAWLPAAGALAIFLPDERREPAGATPVDGSRPPAGV